MGRLREDYAPGVDFPLASYAAVCAAYVGGMGLLLSGIRGRGRDPRWTPIMDEILLGFATHKLSRIFAKDIVTSPFRAPFVEYKGSAGGGELMESARGHGMRQAIGELANCPFCIAPWVAAGLIAAFNVRPKETKIVMRIFAAVAIADFLQRGYGLLESAREERSERAKLLAATASEAEGALGAETPQIEVSRH